MTRTQYIERRPGRIAFEDHGGAGHLVVAAPGMGDIRQVYRHLVPRLLEGGLRVVTMDLRGLGESGADFTEYTDEAVASDFLAIVEELNAGPAVLIGNSLSAASAVIAATRAPAMISGIALLGPFVRTPNLTWWQKMLFRLILAPPWGRAAWVSYYNRSLYPGAKPDDLNEYTASLSENLAQPGRMLACRRLAANDHAESGRCIESVTQPTSVVMGTADPDFPDPVAEANEIGAIMGARVVLAEGSGHYPQADNPELVASAVIELVRESTD